MNYTDILSDIELLGELIMSASPKDTHGPVIKTGPTAGKNRSRNKNGQWRRKRSDAGKNRSTDGLTFVMDIVDMFI